MGLGTFPGDNSLALQMLGMHGTVFANYAVDQADLLLALGVRFDDRVTGKLEAFATRARIVHIDIDPAEICKNKEAHIPICAGGFARRGMGAEGCRTGYRIMQP
jgi:acetolactate synthase-1/2/3 large subunit